MRINRTFIWLAAVVVFAFGGYVLGRATANREWTKVYAFSLYAHVADKAVERSFVLEDLRTKPREQLVARLEKQAIPALEVLAEVDPSMAHDWQWSHFEQQLKYVSAYYRAHPDSKLSPKARRALQIAEPVP
ncbi:hypothetical protein ACHZ97_04205 [Lysobacter soli]|uniref:hypothetical protein n=1 Tax=Lysobacter soli TaxID=453783 RepID=UPI0037CBC99E